MQSNHFDRYVDNTDYWLGDMAETVLGHLPAMGTVVGWVAAFFLVGMWWLSVRREAPALRAARGNAVVCWQDFKLLWACRGTLGSWASFGAVLIAMSGPI